MDCFQNKYIPFSYFNILFFNFMTYFGLNYPRLFIQTMPFLYLYSNIVMFFYLYFAYDHYYMNTWYALYLLEEETDSSKEESDYDQEESDYSDHFSDSENDKEKKE